ncbi:MAG: hypothetical protein FJW38_08905 [Acidobacteria bacterium]|nr:hypothetical protein [Acidobacteriota bacterium]
MAIELSQLSLTQREQVYRDLASQGLYVAKVGDRVQGCGGEGQISSVPPTTVMVDGRLVATVGAVTNVPTDAHGCPACPHPALGVIVTALPDVLANGRPVVVAGSQTRSYGCCGSGAGWVKQGRDTSGRTKTITLAEAIRVRGRLVRGA